MTDVNGPQYEEYSVCEIWLLCECEAAAEARGRAGRPSAAASSFTGMTLQEAQQILNISTLKPEEIQKVSQISITVFSLSL